MHGYINTVNYNQKTIFLNKLFFHAVQIYKDRQKPQFEQDAFRLTFLKTFTK